MSQEERLERIVAGWIDRLDRGLSVDWESACRENEDLAEELRARHAALDLVECAYTRENGRAASADQRIDEYRILREIGRGGMGVVYEALQETLNRRVALKVLSPTISGQVKAVKRFQREAMAAARLHHTNIVPIHDMGQDGGRWFYAMELVEGRPLDDVVAELKAASPTGNSSGGPLDGNGKPPTTGSFADTDTGTREHFVRLAEAFAEVADALQLAHEEGVIHRDIKPSNLLLDANGALKIVDFGLARLVDDKLGMTLTGDLLATPLYMSPEQAMAKRIQIDHRTDIYSLGATLYEVLVCRPPFQAETLQDLCSQIITKEPALPRRTNKRVPRDLETIVLKAMDKDRDKRYQTAREFARDLRAFAVGGGIRARRIRLPERAWRKVKRHRVRSVLIAAVLLLAATGALLGWRAMEENARRAELDYLALCGRGFEETVRVGDQERRYMLSDFGPESSFDRAVELLPERPEAWFGRALRPSRSPEQRLEDLEAARVRGLSERTYHLARAEVFRAKNEWDRVREEELLAHEATATSPVDLVLEGRLLRAQGRYEEALALLEEAIGGEGGSDPVLLLARWARADVRECLGDYHGALEDLLVARGGSDRSGETAIRIASLWKKLGQGETAEAAFRRALADTASRGTVEAWQRLCVATLRWVPSWFGRVTRAGIEAHPDSTTLICLRVSYLRSSAVDRPEEALALAEEAAQRFPASSTAHRALAMVLGTLGRFTEALASIEEAVAHAPSWQVSHLELDRGGVLEDSGRTEDAREIYEASLSERPYDPIVLERYGLLLQSIGRAEDSLEMLDRAAAVAPGWPAVHVNRAFVLMHQGRLDEALGASERAVALDPEYALARLSRSCVLRDLGRLSEALEATDAALRLNPDLPMAHGVRGDILQRQGCIEEALVEYEAEIRRGRLDPDPDVLHNRAMLLGMAKRCAEALVAVEDALRLVEDDARLHNLKGSILRKLGLSAEALASGREASRLAPDDPCVLCNLGHTLLALGRFEEALDVFHRAEGLEARCSDQHGSPTRWILMTEDWLQLDRRLERLLAGEESSEDNLERAVYAKLCHLRNLYGEEFWFDDQVVALGGGYRGPEDLPVELAALRAAALLGSGMGGESLEEADLRWWRDKARAGLRACLENWRAVLEVPPDEATARATAHLLARVDSDPELSPVRDPAALAELPAKEREAWTKLWREWRAALEGLPEGIRPDAPARSEMEGCPCLCRLGGVVRSVVTHLRAAEFLAQGRYEDACRAAEEAIAETPIYHEAHRTLALALLGLGRAEEAQRTIDRGLDLAPDDRALLLAKGKILLEHSGREAALEYFLPLAEQLPDDPLVRTNVGSLLLEEGRSEEAIGHLDAALDLLRDGASGEQGGSDALVGQIEELRGRARFALKDYDAALAALDRAESLGQDGSRLHLTRAAALLYSRRFEEALAACNAVPEEPGSVYLRAQSLYALGRREEFLREYERSVQSRSELAWRSLHLAASRVLCDLGRYTESLRIARRILEVDPENVNAHFQCAYALRYLERWDRAAEACERALEHPDPLVRLTVAVILAKCDAQNARRPARALEITRGILEEQPQEPHAWCGLGEILLEDVDVDEAVGALRKGLSLFERQESHRSCECYHRFVLSTALCRQGKRDEARGLFRRAEDWRVENEPALDYLRRISAQARAMLGW